MRLEQVRAFVVLAEELHFRRAAGRLFVSQPTLSAQIAAFERDLGVVLFERGRAGTRLTDDGESLLPLARATLRSLDALEHGAGRRGRPAEGRVRVGIAPDGIGPATWSAIHRLSSERTDLDVSLRPVGFTTMLSSLADGYVDAVLLHGPVASGPCHQVATVGEARVAVMMPRSHPLAAGTEVSLDDVVPLLRAAPPAGAGREFADFWLARDHTPTTRATDLHLAEDAAALASDAGRLGLVGLWPADVPVPEGSGAVVRSLVDDRWAPLQVVHRPGLGLAESLVGAARAAVAATARPGVVRPVGVTPA